MNHIHPPCSGAARSRSRVQGPVLASLGGLLVGPFLASPSLAQTQGGAASAAATNAVEEVVVTARKTQEKLQEVPLSITAINAKTIQDAGLRNLQDVANLTAGLTISAAGAEAYLAPTIRGLTNLNGGSGDPNVAVFLDGIYLANNSAISLGLVAIERVEVVKGPVGALYGRNAFAGAINYVSKKPPKAFEGEIELGLGNAGAGTVKATLGGALSPGVASWLLSIGADTSNGTWKDAVNGARAGGYDKKDGLLSVRLTPTSALLVDAAVYYGDDQFDNVALGIADNNCGTKTAANAPVNANAFRQFCGRFTYNPVQLPTFKPSVGVAGNSRTVLFEKLRVGYDFGLLDGSLLFGHNDVKQRRLNDFTGLRDGILYALADAATPGVFNGRTLLSNETFGNYLANKDDQIELRLASKQAQALRWSLGFNYFKSSFDSRTILGVATSGVPAGMVLANVIGLPINALWGSPDGAVGSVFGKTTGSEKTKSPFVGADWDILPALTLSGELRRTHQDKVQTIFSTTSNAAPVNTAGNGTNTGERSFAFTNYRAALRYKLADDNIVYISSADGTKAGGFNGRATIAEDLSFNPENNTTLEVGSKMSFFNRKLAVGLALFKVDTEDIQISGPAADPKNPGLVTKNFGGTKSTGFELDIAAVPITGLRLNAGIGYADSKFKADAFDYGVPVADCNLIPTCAPRLVVISTPSGNKTALKLDGLRVPRSSKVSAVLGAQFNGTVNETWGWMGRVDYRYESSRMIQNANLAYIPSKTVVNLRAGLESEKYRLVAYVNNVTNDGTPEGVAQNVRLNDFTGPYAGGLPARRSYGLVGSVNF